MGSWQNTPIAIGGWDDGDRQVEHFENGFWSVKFLSYFPFVNFNIYDYSMASLNEDLFLFGKFKFNVLRTKNVLKVDFGMIVDLIQSPNTTDELGP